MRAPSRLKVPPHLVGELELPLRILTQPKFLSNAESNLFLEHKNRFFRRNWYFYAMTLGEIIIAGAAGGAAKEISQNAWQLGQKWITSYFRDQRPEAMVKAEENAAQCVDIIAKKVQSLEEDARLNRSLFDRALVEPDFGILLQKALIGAAQTEDPTKKGVLAEIVTNRLTAESESLYSVAAQTAAETVAKCTPIQLKILAFAANFSKVKVIPRKVRFDSHGAFVAFCQEQFEMRFGPLVDLPVSRIDVRHLEALSCFQAIWLDHGGSWDRELIAWRAEDDDYYDCLTASEIDSFPSSTSVKNKRNQLQIHHFHLSTTGALIGVLASDAIAGYDSDSLKAWKNPELVPAVRNFGPLFDNKDIPNLRTKS